MAELWPGGPLTLPHEIMVDDHRLVVPEIPAATLLWYLATGCWWDFYPGAMDPEHLWPFTLRWHDPEDPYDYEHLWDIGSTLLGRLSGLASFDGATDGYWPARRLASTATIEWPQYNAWCAAHGRKPLGGHLYEIMGAIHGWMLDRAGPGERDKLNQLIFAPPPYVPITEEAAIPRHLRDQEAALALQALQERLPGEERVTEWTNTPRP